MTPFRKLEKALCADVFTLAIIPELAFVQSADGQLNVYPGLNYEEMRLPRMQVAVPDVSPAQGFEAMAYTREYVADVYIALLSSAERADDDRRDEYDELISAVQAVMEDHRSDTSLQDLLNYPAEGADERTVKEIYVYQARLMSQSQDPLERGVWQILLHYQVEFCGHDGVAEA